MATSKIQAEKTLLWENPNPTAAFPAQFINMDLSGYGRVEVVAKHWSNSDVQAIAQSEALAYGEITILQSSNGHFAFRDWQGYTDKIYVGAGRDFYGTTSSQTDHAAIPLRIYGIK